MSSSPVVDAGPRPAGTVVVVEQPLTRLGSRALHATLRNLVSRGARDVLVDLRHPGPVHPAGAGVLRLYSDLLPRLGGSLTVTARPPAATG